MSNKYLLKFTIQQEENIFLNFSDLEPVEKDFFIKNTTKNLYKYKYLILSYRIGEKYPKIYINLLNLEDKADQKKPLNLINLNYLYIILSK